MQRLILIVVLALVLAGVSSVGTGFVSPSLAADPVGVDLNKVFRCAAKDKAGTDACLKARSLIVNNCTICHTFVPIVMQQFDGGGWTSLLERHVAAERTTQLSAQDVTVIHDYLTANFNGKLPPPELPPALLESWTSY